MGRRAWGGLRGWLAAALVAAIVGGGVADEAAVGSPTAVQVDLAVQSAAVDGILQRRAAAVLQRDEAQFLADVDPYNKKLQAAQKVLFGNLVQFGFGKLAYLQDVQQFDQTLVDKYGPTAYLVSVVMEYQIDGIDELPMQTALGYTFMKRGGRYLLVDDTHLDTAMPDGPHQEAWDTGPVLVQREARTMAVVEPGNSQLAASILADAQVAVKAVNKWWLSSWKGGGMVIALDDHKVRGTDFDGPDLKDYSAVASPVFRKLPGIAEGGAEYGGSYVVVNPSKHSKLDAPLLAHEFTHVASAQWGPSAPYWLIEGAAEYVLRKPMAGERDVDLARARNVARSKYMNKAKALPTNKRFHQTKDSSYAISWYVVDYLVGKYGLPLVVGLYQELAGRPDTPARREAAMIAQLGRTEAQIFADAKRG